MSLKKQLPWEKGKKRYVNSPKSILFLSIPLRKASKRNAETISLHPSRGFSKHDQRTTEKTAPRIGQALRKDPPLGTLEEGGFQRNKKREVV